MPFQVVRLASFQHAPSVPPFLTLPKHTKVDGDDSIMPNLEDRKVNEIAVGGGGVAVAVTRFPTEQKRPVGPLIVVGVRDGVLWLIDRYSASLHSEFTLLHFSKLYILTGKSNNMVLQLRTVSAQLFRVLSTY